MGKLRFEGSMPGLVIHILDVLDRRSCRRAVVVVSLARGCTRPVNLTINLYLAASTIVLFLRPTTFFSATPVLAFGRVLLLLLLFGCAILTIGLYFTLMGPLRHCPLRR